MQEIAIKIIEHKGFNTYIAIDKHNIKYDIQDQRPLKIGNYYKIIITTENRSLGMLGTKTRIVMKSLEELQVINNKLCLIDGTVFISA